MKNNFYQIIKEICEELEIQIEEKSLGWILQLKKEGKTKYIVGYNFPLNAESSALLVSDKFATYEVLNAAGIPAVKHTLVFNPISRQNYMPPEGNSSTILEAWNQYKKLVIKPNTGSQGKDVMLCQSLKETEMAIQKLFLNNSSICICPYYEIATEYRTFYLNGEIKLIYGKEKPYVIGDGYSTLEQLIAKLKLPSKMVVKDNLALLDMNYVPKQDEKVELSWKHNLSGGAKANVLEKGELYQKIEELALKAGKVADVSFATIDVIQTRTNELLIMEINAGVVATLFSEIVEGGYEMAKDMYREAIKAMF